MHGQAKPAKPEGDGGEGQWRCVCDTAEQQVEPGDGARSVFERQ